jgi:Ran GTPase-activating protein (RanGAP) involved in mRNA processing and transport
MDKDTVKVLCRCLLLWKGLESLNLSSCMIAEESCEDIIHSLTFDHEELKVLKLRNNDLGLAGVVKLLDFIKNKVNLELLDLSGNQFHPKSNEVGNITEALKQMGKSGALCELEDMEEIEDENSDLEKDVDSELENDVNSLQGDQAQGPPRFNSFMNANYRTSYEF